MVYILRKVQSTSMSISDLLKSNTGSIIISVVLGLGLAALFRKACSDNKCVVIKGPNTEETRNYHYKINDECYKYEPVFTDCATKI